LKTYISNLPPTEELSELKFHIYASNQIQERLQKSNYLLKKHLQSSLDKSEGLEQKLKAANSEVNVLLFLSIVIMLHCTSHYSSKF